VHHRRRHAHGREFGLLTEDIRVPGRIPERTQGEAIPIFARVVAIADVFDALMSRRAYKEARPADAVRQEFESSSGSHFDPELVRLFLADFDDYVRLHSMISD
jgi:putative two-component system response regulator